MSNTTKPRIGSMFDLAYDRGWYKTLIHHRNFNLTYFSCVCVLAISRERERRWKSKVVVRRRQGPYWSGWRGKRRQRRSWPRASRGAAVRDESRSEPGACLSTSGRRRSGSWSRPSAWTTRSSRCSSRMLSWNTASSATARCSSLATWTLSARSWLRWRAVIASTVTAPVILATDASAPRDDVWEEEVRWRRAPPTAFSRRCDRSRLITTKLVALKIWNKK